MSNEIFPLDLPGLDIKVKRTPVYRTKIQEAVSGKELRAAFWSFPRYRYALAFNFLRQSKNGDEVKTLVGFFHRHAGQWDSFLFKDPYESSVTSNQFGTGNGSAVAFQLVDGSGHPITDLNGTPSIYRTDWQGTQLLYSTARTNKSVQSQNYTTGWTSNSVTPSANVGTAPDGTATLGRLVESASTAVHGVYHSIGSVNSGDWVIASAFASALSSTRSVAVNLYGAAFPGGSSAIQFNPTTGAVEFGYNVTGCTYGAYPVPGGGYRFWLRRQAGATGTFTVEHDIAKAGINNASFSYAGDGVSGVHLWGSMVEAPASGLVPSSYIPTTTTAVTVTDYTMTGTGLVTLAVAPVSGAVLSWAGSYYRRVRFDMDEMDLERLMMDTVSGGGQTWDAKTIKMISVK